MSITKRIVFYLIVIFIIIYFINLLSLNKSKNLRNKFNNQSSDHKMIRILMKRSLDLENEINKIYLRLKLK